MPRDFRQLGMGYGVSPVSITASVNGSQVFSGTVPTLDQPVPGDITPVQPPQETCFSWTEPDTSWTGTRSFQLVNTGSGIFRITRTQAIGDLSAEDGWSGVFFQEISTPAGNVAFTDPFTEVSIDGVPQSRPEYAGHYGQWHWTVAPGSTFTATLNVNQPAWIPDPEYPVQE